MDSRNSVKINLWSRGFKIYTYDSLEIFTGSTVINHVYYGSTKVAESLCLGKCLLTFLY